MNFLNGLLAFAVTMIVLSTVVAAVVEFVHEVRRKRERYMRAYLLNFFDTQIVSMFRDEIAQLAHRHRDNLAETAKLARRNAGMIGRVGHWLRTDSVGKPARAWLDKKPPAFSGLTVGGLLAFLAAVLTVFLLSWTNSFVLAALVAVAVLYFYDQRRQELALLGSAVDGDKALEGFRQKFVNDIVRIGDETGDRATYITRLKPTDFAAALGRSELGGMIVTAGRDRLDLLITDILRRFDETGTASVTEFQKQSRTLSIVAAFAVAVVLNVNAVTLLKAYFADEPLAARVAALYTDEQLEAMAGTLNAVNAEALRRWETYRDENNALQAAQEAIESAEKSIADARDAGTADEDIPELATLDGLRKEAAKLAEKVNQVVSSLGSAAVPVGWRYFPYCVPDEGVTPPGCASVKTLDHHLTSSASGGYCHDLIDYMAWASPLTIACTHVEAGIAWARERQAGLPLWLGGVVIAGALIGLGGPFWFDVYRRLSTLTQLAQSLGMGGAKPEPEQGTKDAASKDDPQKAHAPPNAVDAFKEAVAARALTGAVAGASSARTAPRRLLKDDGT